MAQDKTHPLHPFPPASNLYIIIDGFNSPHLAYSTGDAAMKAVTYLRKEHAEDGPYRIEEVKFVL